jgi:hypothetical protein
MSLGHEDFIIPEMVTAITEDIVSFPPLRCVLHVQHSLYLVRKGKSPAAERMFFSDRLYVLEKEVANLACHRLLIFLPACILDWKVS